MDRVAAPLNRTSGGQLYLDDTFYRRIPARLTSVTTVSGQNRYGFIEEIWSATTGVYSDRTGRLVGDGTNTYATELNNNLLSGLTPQTPTPPAGTGPFVWLYFKGYVGSNAVYEFSSGAGSSYLTSNLGTTTALTTSWSSIGLSLTLPANSVWNLQAQLNAEISSSAAGAGDTISMRLYDGSAVVGCPVEFCDVVCDGINFVDAAAIFAVYVVGGSSATVNVQGIINTSSGSTASVLGCTGSYGTAIVGVRWA